MSSVSPAAYGLLGLLATRSWTGYELTQQVRRSLRYIWPVSDGHLYREQGRLVELGWVAVDEEPAGRRTRKRYTITVEGRAALRDWLATSPQEPAMHIEGVLRAFYADQGSVDDLVASLVATADAAGTMLSELGAFVTEYLDDEGPLSMLERGVGGPEGERLEFRGRPMYPERLHAVALALDTTTALLSTIASSFAAAASDAAAWPSSTDPSLTPQTRRRLEAAAARVAGAQP